MDPLLDAMQQKPDTHPDIVDERMPYWAELWPSAQALAETILDPRRTLPANRWLELGCGPGLAGLAARLRGCPGTFTDYQEEALWLAELNAAENNFPSAELQLLDWRNIPQDLKAPWILASDVAYETRNFQPLIDAFDRLLTPEGEIWFAEPGRSITQPFFQELKEAGWSVRPLHRQIPVTVYRIHRHTMTAPEPHTACHSG
jgi:predicted nicotinamide N-methyase